ncbi:hypothetical protein ATCC90586_001019 [Pythium insidiosum]|nr:hypothetical protein ATCC90586_001019 [Pythium insidiosum]
MSHSPLHPLVVSIDNLAISTTSPPTTPLPPLRDLFEAMTWSPPRAGNPSVPPLRNCPLNIKMIEPMYLPQAISVDSIASLTQTVARKIAKRSLWKCRRRPLSMQDLLSVDNSELLGQQRRSSHRRQCGAQECNKYALSGGYCISHGGGKPCRFDGCTTVAQSGGLCKAHGGGSKCKSPGCGSVARRKGFCMMHGGRQPCKIEDCNKCAHGGGLCIAHGGGKRCASLGCPKSAQAGGFCYSHGGGKRCSAPQCFQAARKGGRESKIVWEADDVKDTANVDELSDLFSAIEEESEDAVDFSLLIEGEDAFNVEDVSEMFTDLEEAADVLDCATSSSSTADEDDARAVDELSSLFSDLEDNWQMDEELAMPSPCRRVIANGLAGRTNELLVRVASTVEAVANVVFFPGDVQGARDDMMAGSFAEFADYSYENVAELLAHKFGDDVNVWIVQPSRFERGIFACFEGFVQCNKFGAVKTLHGTYSIAQNKVCRSKGGVVLNQLVAEASHWRRLQSQNNPSSMSLGAMDRQIDSFFSSLQSIHWVDSGNGSYRGAYPTDEATLRALAQLRSVKLFVHTTPYQLDAPERPWIRKEAAQLVAAMERMEQTMTFLRYHDGETPSLRQHFQILRELQLPDLAACSKTGAPLSPEISPQPIHIQNCA